MAFDFPSSPVLDQTYTAHGVTFKWNSYAWVQQAAATGVTDGDKGDITVSASGGTWLIDPAVVTNAKLAAVATSTIKGRSTAGSGDPEDLTATQAKTILSLDNVNNTSDANKPVSTATQTALNLKADLASPTFTGDPKAPTPATADNDTSIATTAFVKAQGYIDATALNPYAPLASPTFTGDPKAPTPLTADNDTSIATTAFVKAQGYVTGGPYQAQDGDLTAISALAGTNTIYYRSAADTWSAVVVSTGLSFSGGNLTCTVSTSGLAPLASPVFTGDPQAPTPATADNDTSIATTAFVKAQGYVTGGPYQAQDGDLTALAALAGTNTIYYRSAADTWSAVTVSTGLSFSGGALTCTVSTSGFATLASPTFTGDPKAPTATVDDNDTSIATTAFVIGQAGASNPIVDGTAAPGISTRWSRQDHVHPTDTSRAPLASPVFTGDPQAPTPATADNDTSIATTAFVKAQGYITGGPYQPLDGDLTALAALAGTGVIYYRSAADTWAAVTIGTGLSFSSGTLANTVSTSGLAPLASPVFTGDPQAPTPATADNDTSIATTAFVKAQGYLTSSALSPYAPLASPALTGNPTAPTPGAGDNDTSIATTAFVQGELAIKANIYVSTTAPASAPDNSLWYENDSGLLFVRYNDGTTTQWVAVAARSEATP